MRNRIHFLCVVLLLCVAVKAVHSQSFECDGELTYSNHRYPYTSPPTSVRKKFSIAVDGCKSIIRTANLGSSNYVEAGFDGTDIVTLNSQWKTNSGNPENLTSANVERRPAPRDDSSNINYLWLAYSSACYFDSITNQMVLPIWVLDDPQLIKDQFKLPALWTRSAGYSPERVDFLGDGYWHLRGKDGPLVSKMPEPFDKTFTNATYVALEVTNAFNAIIPTRFTFTRYGVTRSPTGSWHVVTLTRTDAEVTQIRKLTSGRQFLPEFKGVLYVSDNRFATAAPPVLSLNYKVTNGDWRPLPNLFGEYRKELRVTAARQKAESDMQKIVRPKRFWVMLILLIVVSLPIILVLFRKKRDSR
jgi:hypothetical protein